MFLITKIGAAKLILVSFYLLYIVFMYKLYINNPKELFVFRMFKIKKENKNELALDIFLLFICFGISREIKFNNSVTIELFAKGIFVFGLLTSLQAIAIAIVKGICEKNKVENS